MPGLTRVALPAASAVVVPIAQPTQVSEAVVVTVAYMVHCGRSLSTANTHVIATGKIVRETTIIIGVVLDPRAAMLVACEGRWSYVGAPMLGQGLAASAAPPSTRHINTS